MAMHLSPALLQIRRQFRIAVWTEMNHILRPFGQIRRGSRESQCQHTRCGGPDVRCSAGVEGELGQRALATAGTVDGCGVALKGV